MFDLHGAPTYGLKEQQISQSVNLNVGHTSAFVCPWKAKVSVKPTA